jgi:hypothetical protein
MRHGELLWYQILESQLLRVQAAEADLAHCIIFEYVTTKAVHRSSGGPTGGLAPGTRGSGCGSGLQGANVTTMIMAASS